MNEFKVDFQKLDNLRPIGVSGLMRVKNDGVFVAASIDSCIDALDELVIVYDDSEDNTEEVIKRKREEYPDKIKIYYYEPKIMSHNLSDTEIERLEKIPEDSPQLLSSYYNWTMSKASYRYAFKIDADQIYFSSKLKMICDLYRSSNKQRIFLSEHICYFIFLVIRRLSPNLPISLISILSRSLFKKNAAHLIQSYVFKRIKNDKIISSFSGINLFYYKELYVPMGKFDDGIQPPTNGSGDHIFFMPNSHDKYVPWPQKEYHRVIEVFSPSSRMYFGGGFLWLHLNAMRDSIYERNIVKYKNHTLKINQFLSQDFFDLKRKYDFKISRHMLPIIFQAISVDKELIMENVNNKMYLIAK